MTTATSTHPSTRPLSETARHICIPAGIVSTGWDSVEKSCRRTFGIGFDQWQKDIGRLTLAKRGGGLYAAAVGGVILSIPRQTGKTYLIAWMVFALCTLIPDLTVVWTAHRTRTSDETFKKMSAMAERPKVKPVIEGKPRVANGQQQIEFVNGSRILFGAREQGFGRGFDKVDILVLDEGQILTENAMTDMVPATNAAPNGLVIIMGTPPRPKDPGEVFKARRQDALDGDPDTLYVELSAERGAKIIDWKQVEIANPSFPHRTGKTAILRMQKLLGSDINFYREAYGIWDEETSGISRLIPADDWQKVQVTEPPPGDGVRSLGMVFDFDTNHGALAGVVKHAGGAHIELIDHGPVNLDSLARWMAERWRDLGMIAICGGGGAKALVQKLRDEKVPERVIRVMTTPEYYAANVMLQDAVTHSAITIPAAGPDDALTHSVSVSDKKVLTAGWRWASTSDSPTDRLPIEAVSVALWAARTNKRKPGRRQEAR